MPSPVEQFKTLANRLTANNIEIINDLYSDDLHFVDPVVDIRGLEAVRAYYVRLYKGVKTISFAFESEVVGAESAVLFWTMHMEHKRFRKGETVHVPGCSHLAYREKIHYHRDYFDLGVLIYERVPLLGGVIRRIKSQL